jgi:hypothetical protein
MSPQKLGGVSGCCVSDDMVTFRRVLFFRIPVRLGWLTLKQGKDGCFLSELVGGVSEFDGVSAGESERGF